MTTAKHKSAAAFTLIEIAMAIAIVTIVIVGCSMLFATGRNYINLQRNYRTAVQLAAQKLDNFKAGSYSSITDGPLENIDFDGTSYKRATAVVNEGSYKQVTVSVTWEHSTDPHVSLVTIIAP